MKKFWMISYGAFLISWVLGALLWMMRFHGGFITNYLADISFPGWFYMHIRGLHRTDNKLPSLTFFGTYFGVTPERAIISIFCVGIISEYITKYWPNGFIRGRFDTQDILCYAISLLIPYTIEKIINKPKLIV